MCVHIQCCRIICFLYINHCLFVIYQVRQRLWPLLSHQLGVDFTMQFLSLVTLGSNLLSAMSVEPITHGSDTKQAIGLASCSQSCKLDLLS